MFTFFFWLDLVGTISLLIDIPWFMVGIGFSQSVFLIVKGGRMGKAARGANASRLLKLMKMIRMLKLFRIVHVLKKTQQNADATDHGTHTDQYVHGSEMKAQRVCLLLNMFTFFFAKLYNKTNKQ